MSDQISLKREKVKHEPIKKTTERRLSDLEAVVFAIVHAAEESQLTVGQFMQCLVPTVKKISAKQTEPA